MRLRYFLALMLLALTAKSATVTGPIVDAGQTPYNGQFLQFQFTPIGNPQVINGTTVWTKAVTVTITNGTFTNFLDGGMYWVGYVGEGINGQPPKTSKALVPPFDTNSYTLGQCLQFATNGLTFYWTNQPALIAGTNIAFTTNGAYLVINSTASGGGGTTYTNGNIGVAGTVTGSQISTNQILRYVYSNSIPIYGIINTNF